MHQILIQLIGKQTIPNLVCIKALRPDVVLNVYTERTRDALAAIENFVGERLPETHPRSAQTDVPFPSADALKKLLSESIDALRSEFLGAEIVVNYTGGTKPMAIGAYLAAAEKNALPLYVEDAQTILEGLALSPCVRWTPEPFSLEEIFAASGLRIDTAKTPDASRLRLAEELARLRAEENAAFREKRQLTRFSLYPAQDESALGIRKNFYHALPNAERIFDEVVLAPDNRERFAAVCGLCVEAGILARRENGSFIFSETVRASAETLTAENAFLDGGWWELLVAEAVRRVAGDDNVRWSVFAEGMEDDVVAVIENRLFIVSCKAGTSQKSFYSELHRIASRARRLGGIDAHPVFACFGHLKWKIRSLAAAMGIPVLGAADVRAPAEVLRRKLLGR